MRDEVVGGLILAAILAALGFLWRNRGRVGEPSQWIARIWRDRKKRRNRADDEQLRRDVLLRAEFLGRSVPIASKRLNNGAIAIEFSDGQLTWYVADFGLYELLMRSGEADPTRTFRKDPPEILARWSRAKLEEWLERNA
jgi:hypothetical protein